MKKSQELETKLINNLLRSYELEQSIKMLMKDATVKRYTELKRELDVIEKEINEIGLEIKFVKMCECEHILFHLQKINANYAECAICGLTDRYLMLPSANDYFDRMNETYLSELTAGKIEDYFVNHEPITEEQMKNIIEESKCFLLYDKNNSRRQKIQMMKHCVRAKTRMRTKGNINE